MTSKRTRIILAAILIVSLTSVQQITASSGQVSSATREVPVTVKVVFVGFEEQWVDKSYFVWNYQTPSQRTNNIWNWNNWQQTGVTYKISYDLSFAQPSFKGGLVEYLKSIGEKRSGVNRWFYYWQYSDSDKMWVKKFYETNYGPGVSEFLKKAIGYYCERQRAG